MASPQTAAAVTNEPGLKVAAVEVPSTDQNERRTRDGKWTLRQLRQTDAIVPLQSGTNQFDSQRGKTGFGMPRNTQTAVEFADNGKRWTIEQLRTSDSIVRLQSGTNQFESQKRESFIRIPYKLLRGSHRSYLQKTRRSTVVLKHQGMTGFGMPRDVKGKHLKRIWELEFPEEAVADQAPPPVNQQQ